ncbi:MAG: hypothetical protein AAF982_06575, partial [Pseudomonadota bacterium]
MKGFEPVTLTWRGASFTVKAEDQLRLIAEIEDALSDSKGTPAVLSLMRPGGPGYARLSAAYGAALRYAGADVTDQDIYLSINEELSEGDPTAAIRMQNAIIGLLAIVSPPAYRRLMMEDAEDTMGKPQGEGR